MDEDLKHQLEDYEANMESQLNLIYSTPITDGGAFPMSASQVDKITFLQDQIDETQEILDFGDDEDDALLLKYMGNIKPQVIIPKGRKNSDETYVLGLCDEVLGQISLRQYTFNFLVGDTGRKLPVDAYYPALDLVIEYHERQHTEKVPFFDKKKTVSGVTRGEQRRIYDERRRTILPRYGISLVVISYTDFGKSRKLKRDPQKDKVVIANILAKYINKR